MEKGMVKFFDSRDNKRFGFIIVDGGGEVFFHFNDGRNIDPGEIEPCFGDYSLEADPRNGQYVVFERTRNAKGAKAAPWGFADDYDWAKEKIAQRPAPEVYRVMKQIRVCGNQPDKPEVLWEGSDIVALSRKYPRTKDRRIDDLNPNFSCGDFDQSIWFEFKTTGEWERTDDPRPEEQSGNGRRRYRY